jgi:hypothetical protein
MKLISILVIFMAALSADANDYECRTISKNSQIKLRLSIDQKQASFFNGKYWSVLEQVAFKLNRSEPVYKFQGTDTFKDNHLVLIFNEFQGTAELFKQELVEQDLFKEVKDDQQSLKFQCLF